MKQLLSSEFVAFTTFKTFHVIEVSYQATFSPFHVVLSNFLWYRVVAILNHNFVPHIMIREVNQTWSFNINMCMNIYFEYGAVRV